MCEWAWVRALMSRRENMLIAFMNNAKLHEHRVLHNKHNTPSAAAQRKNNVLEYWRKAIWIHACCMFNVRTHVYLWESVFLCACIFAWMIPLSESLVSPLSRAHCACFFSSTPDSQPRCDPTLLSYWPKPVNSKAKEEDRDEKEQLPGATHANNPQLIKHTLTNTHQLLTHGHRRRAAHKGCI